MNRPAPASQDPMVRLQQAEKNIHNLTVKLSNLSAAYNALKQRVYTLEVECGLRVEGETDEELDGALG